MKYKNHTLYIMTGAPGSGKYTTAIQVAGDENTFSVDDYFYKKSGDYCVDLSQMPAAFNNCKERLKLAMLAGKEIIAVTNSNYDLPYDDYITLAKQFGYNVKVIHNTFLRNVNGELVDNSTSEK